VGGGGRRPVSANKGFQVRSQWPRVSGFAIFFFFFGNERERKEKKEKGNQKEAKTEKI